MMREYNRVDDTVRNTIFGLISKIIILLGAFATRTMLIYSLGVNYVGLEGLFASVLTMLNMAELGFGSAVVYKLYKPLSEDDTDAVCALLNYYKKIYRTIGMVVFLLGVLCIPFLHKFVSGEFPPGINLYWLYAIYLFNTCLSYWLFAYKSVLINANNRNDLISKTTSAVNIIKYLLQFLLLLLFKNYYIYALVIPLTTLMSNVGNSIIAKKYYPQYVCNGEISIEDKREIKNKVMALMYNKLGVTIISGSDNIVISSFLGLTILGIYDSYYYIFTMLYYFFSVLHSAITAGVGNSILTQNIKKNKELFDNAVFINSWLVGWCAICLACLYEPFMKVWIGKENTLGIGFAILMSMYFYFWMIRFITIIFKNAQGLWWEDRYRAALEGIVNLVLNIILVQFIGIHGVTLSTILAMLIVSLPWETKVLFRKYFEEKTMSYYVDMLRWILTTVISGGATYLLCDLIIINDILNLVLRLVICLIVPNFIFFITYRHNKKFNYAIELAKKIIIKGTRK